MCAVRWSALFGLFFHAGLCRFEIVGACARGVVGRWLADGALRNRGPALLCRQDYFSTTGTRAGADWSRCFAVLMCAHRPTLYFRTSAMRLRRLAADSLKRLVQLIHFAWSRRLSPENWCFGSENGLFFGFEGYFGVFLVIFGRETGTFTHFL